MISFVPFGQKTCRSIFCNIREFIMAILLVLCALYRAQASRHRRRSSTPLKFKVQNYPEASLAIRKFVCHIMLAVSVMPHQCDHDQQRYSYCLQLNCQPQTGRWWSRPSPARSRRPAAWQPISGIAYFAPFSCGFSEVPCCHLPILVPF